MLLADRESWVEEQNVRGLRSVDRGDPTEVMQGEMPSL